MQAQEDQTSVMAARISKLEKEKHHMEKALRNASTSGGTDRGFVTDERLVEQISLLEAAHAADQESMRGQLAATSEVFASKARMAKQLAAQQAQIDELRRLLTARQPDRSSRFWDEDKQSFVALGASSVSGSPTAAAPPSTLSTKARLLAAASSLGDEMARTLRASTGPATPAGPAERWSRDEVREWVQRNGGAQGFVLAEKMFSDAITGVELLELQPHDLEVSRAGCIHLLTRRPHSLGRGTVCPLRTPGPSCSSGW